MEWRIMKKNPALGANWRSWRSEDRSVQCPVLKSSVIHRVLCPVNGIEELKKRHLEFHSSVIHSILRPVPESSVIHWPISSTLKTVKKTTKISILTKWIPIKTMKSHIQKKVWRKKSPVLKNSVIHLILLDHSRLLGETPASQVKKLRRILTLFCKGIWKEG